jgi:hypothetical protein
MTKDFKVGDKVEWLDGRSIVRRGIVQDIFVRDVGIKDSDGNMLVKSKKELYK